MAHVCHIGIVDVESAASGFERDLSNPHLRSQTPKIRPRPAPNRPGAMALGHVVAQREWNRRDTTMAVRADVRMKIVPRTPRLGSDASGHPSSIGIAARVTLGGAQRSEEFVFRGDANAMPMAIILCRACWLDMCRGSRDRCGRCPVIAMQRLDAFDFRKALELERLDDDVQPQSPFQGMGRSLGVGLGLAVALLCALASKAQQFANLLPRLSAQTQHSHYRARSLSTLLTNLLQICDHGCEVIFTDGILARQALADRGRTARHRLG